MARCMGDVNLEKDGAKPWGFAPFLLPTSFGLN